MSNKTRKKQIENQTQQGRSMVEMLGVLAIIGVLSIGGIAGYRMAMNRYQANQIAHEINLMRTDAKMKVARGVELLLGEPYDGEEGHLKFNESYGVEVDSSVIISDGEEGREEGYSFTLSNIPGGVCKPLATLLDGMDDTAALEINGKDYETAETPCDNEENEVLVAFSTKDLGGVSGEKECDEETCDGECTSDGRCVQCNESGKKHWNDEIQACAACSDNSHCTNSNLPACIEGVCSKCTEESQCDTAQNKHCKISTGQCITCGKYYYEAAWNETAQKCDYCKNVDPEKPNWTGSECVAECPEGMFLNSSQNRCVECLKNEDCQKDDRQHYWCDTSSSANYGTCKQCPEWDETHGCKIGECESNDDCGPGEYCYLYYGYSCTSEFDKSKGFGAGYNNYKSECRKAESDINKKGDTNSKYIMSTNSSMTWWSAERFCEALGNKHMVTISELQCKHKIQYSGGDCTQGYCHASDTEQGCKIQNKRAGESYYGDVSEVIKELRKAENGTETKGNHSYWLYDASSSSTSCDVHRVLLDNGYVHPIGRNYGYGDALCE